MGVCNSTSPTMMILYSSDTGSSVSGTVSCTSASISSSTTGMLTADGWSDTVLSDLAQPDKQMIASIQAKSNVLFFISHLFSVLMPFFCIIYPDILLFCQNLHMHISYFIISKCSSQHFSGGVLAVYTHFSGRKFMFHIHFSGCKHLISVFLPSIFL